MRTLLTLLLYFFALFIISSPAMATPVALFDQAHGQRFVIEERGGLHLSGLAEAFTRAGYEVRSTTEPLTSKVLAGIDVLVSSGGFVPFTEEEMTAIGDFVGAGGSLAVMLHIAPTYSGLLGKLNILASRGVVHETQNVIGTKSIDFSLVTLRDHPLFEGMTSFNVYGGWPLLNLDKSTNTVGLTSKKAWVDLDRDGARHPRAEPLHTYGMVVAGTIGEGRVAAFGDDAIFQDQFLTGGNLRLAENLATWLAPR